MFARVSILSASGPYLDRPADFPRPPVTQTIIVTPLYGIFEFVSLAVRFRGASRRKGRFFRAHCARSNTATITSESETDRGTRLEGKGRRIRSSLWIYFVLVRSSTRPEWNVVAASIPIATRRYIGFARYSVHIYIYIYTCEFLRTRVSVIYSRHGSICIGLAKCVGWVRGELVGMTVPREANTIAARNSRSVNRDEKDNKDREGGGGARTSR